MRCASPRRTALPACLADASMMTTGKLSGEALGAKLKSHKGRLSLDARGKATKVPVATRSLAHLLGGRKWRPPPHCISQRALRPAPEVA